MSGKGTSSVKKAKAGKNPGQKTKIEDGLGVVVTNKISRPTNNPGTSQSAQNKPEQSNSNSAGADTVQAYAALEDLELRLKCLFQSVKQPKGKVTSLKYKGSDISLIKFEQSVNDTIKLLKSQNEVEMKEMKASVLKKANLRDSTNENEELKKKLEKDKVEMLAMLKQMQPHLFETVKPASEKWDISQFSQNFCTEMINQLVKREDNKKELKTLGDENREMKSILVLFAGPDAKSSNSKNSFNLKTLKDNLENRFRADEEFRKYVIKSTEVAERVVSVSTNDKQESGGNVEADFLSNDTHDEDIVRFNKDMSNIIKRIRNFRSKKTIVEKELNDANNALQLRLSSLAGSRLTEGNPAITNLGDKNRPMKIGEMYSELYDNEWTDIFDHCLNIPGKKIDEDKVLKTLYSTIMFCYKICNDKAKTTMDEFLTSTKKIVMIDKHEDEVKSLVKQVMKSTVEETSELFLKDVRGKKDQSVVKVQNAHKLDKDIFDKVLPSPYFEKCLKVCWKMVVQDPPMAILEGPKQGGTIDKNLFKEYLTSGAKVLYTIWPPLLLHEGGTVLVKGVVKVK